jgi:hypothetical protein
MCVVVLQKFYFSNKAFDHVVGEYNAARTKCAYLSLSIPLLETQ